MHGLMGDRLLKRFASGIRYQPEFGLPRVLGSGSDNGEDAANPPETAKEKSQARMPERGGEAAEVSTSENGAKPAVDENAENSQICEDSMNVNADKAWKQETNGIWRIMKVIMK